MREFFLWVGLIVCALFFSELVNKVEKGRLHWIGPLLLGALMARFAYLLLLTITT